MIRLWPRSLFGRLTLVLTVGLILAQLISAAISLSERDEALFRFSDAQWAQRIAQTSRNQELEFGKLRERVARVASISQHNRAGAEHVTASARDQAVALRELEGAIQELRSVSSYLSDLTRRITSVA